MSAFIVTLATMLVYRSIVQYVCQHLSEELIGGVSSIYRMNSENGMYQMFYQMGNSRLATIPSVGILMKIMVFVIAGIMVGLGAFLWIAMNGSADVN